MKKKIILVCSLLILIPIAIIGLNVYGYYHYTGELVGIKGTSTYHRDNCQFVKKATSTQLVLLGNLESTAILGYRPCTTCNPPNNGTQVKAFKDKQESDKLLATPVPTGKYTVDDFSGSYSENRRKELGLSDPNDLSKLEVMGSSSQNNYGIYTVTCTVKNNDNIQHEIRVQSIFYDGNNKPISTKESFSKKIDSGNIQGFEITQLDNVEKIKRFEIKIIN